MSTLNSKALRRFTLGHEAETEPIKWEEPTQAVVAMDVLDKVILDMQENGIPENVELALRDFNPLEEETPRMVADEEKWEEAVAAVEPDGAGVEFDEPWKLAGMVYLAIGGTFDDQDGDEEGGEAYADHPEPDGDEPEYAEDEEDF